MHLKQKRSDSAFQTLLAEVIWILTHPSLWARFLTLNNLNKMIYFLQQGTPPDLLAEKIRRRSRANEYFYERAQFSPQAFEVTGWLVLRRGVERIEVFHGERKLGEAVIGLPSPNAFEVFPDIKSSANSGFSFSYEDPSLAEMTDLDTLYLVVQDRKGDRQGYIPDWERINYQAFLGEVAPGERAWMQRVSANLRIQPEFHFILLGEPASIDRWDPTLDALREQAYPHWQVVVRSPGERELGAASELSERRLGRSFLHQEPSASAGLDAQHPVWIGFLHPGDRLFGRALFDLAVQINQTPAAGMFYWDEDREQGSGAHQHYFKPDWSPELLLHQDYLGRAYVLRADRYQAAGGLDARGSQPAVYDLTLRVTEQNPKPLHVPRLLSSAPADPSPDPASVRAVVSQALARRQLAAELVPARTLSGYRVRRPVQGEPLVSIIIPTAFRTPGLLESCLRSIAEKSTYPHYELLIVDSSKGRLTDEVLAQWVPASNPFRRIVYNRKFNYSQANNLAAREARGEYLLLLNDDTEVIAPDWIEALLEQAQQPGVGVVGAKLLYANRAIQHASILLVDFGGGGRHAFRFLPEEAPGYWGLAQVPREASAITFACVLVAASIYRQVNGLDEDFRIECNDTDICLRIRELGYSNRWTPFALLFHKELATRLRTLYISDIWHMWDRWRHQLEQGDPFYNPNLSRTSDHFFLNDRRVIMEHPAPWMGPEPDRAAAMVPVSLAPGRALRIEPAATVNDFVLQLPVLQAIRTRFPATPMVWSVSRETQDLAQVFARPSGVELVGPQAGGADEGSETLDLADVTHDQPRFMPRRQDGEGAIPPQDPLAPHLAALSWKVARTQWPELKAPVPQDFQINFPPTEGSLPPQLAQWFATRPVIGLHAGGPQLIRRWPREYFARLADRLIEERGVRIVWFGTRQDRRLNQQILRKMKRAGEARNLAGELDWMEYLTLVQRCQSFIGNCSGPTQLASALQVPTLTLFSGQSLPQQRQPLGDRSFSLRLGVGCAPCSLPHENLCPYGRMCMFHLKPGVVFRWHERLLKLFVPDAVVPRTAIG